MNSPVSEWRSKTDSTNSKDNPEYSCNWKMTFAHAESITSDINNRLDQFAQGRHSPTNDAQLFLLKIII